MGRIFTILLLLSVHASAETLKNIPCIQKVFDTLDGWEAPTGWRSEISADKAEQIVASPTEKVGVWIRLVTTAKKSILVRETAQSSTAFVFEAPSCAPKLAVAPRLKFRKSPSGGFTDKDLEAVLEKSAKSGRSGLIYVWSPNMNFSAKGAAEIGIVAKNLNIDLIVLRDPLVQRSPAEAVARKEKIPSDYLRPVDSTELTRRGILTHYPALLLFKKGKLFASVHPGYDDPPKLQEYIQEKLAQ